MITTPPLSNSATVNAAGAINGAIVENGAGGVTVTGPLAGNGTFVNSGAATLNVNGGSFTGITTLTNTSTAATGVAIGASETLSANAIANAAGATITSSGTLVSLASPLLNAGTINANGGAVNGAIDNKNVFNVGGTVTSNNTFLNEGGASLNVNTGGAYTLAGLLTNAGSITVASNATLNASAGGLTNTSTGTVLNQGTISDVLNNAGAVTNDDMYTAVVASNTGTITNNATWDGTAGTSFNGSGSIYNNGVWKGSWSNNGGTMNNAGTITQDVTNNSGIVDNNSASSVIGGSVTANGGIVYSDNPKSTIGGSVTLPGAPAEVFALGTIGGNVSVSGFGSFYVGDQTASTILPFTTPAAAQSYDQSHLGQTLNVGGNVTSGSTVTIPVDLATGKTNVINIAGSATNASAGLSGILANTGNLLWANSHLVYTNNSLPLTFASQQLLAGASSTGFYQYTPVNNDSILQSLKAGVVSAPATQVSSIITALTTSFFQNAQAFLGVPTNPTPNLLYGGVWSRGGGAAITLETTAVGGGSSYSTETKSINDIGGFQFGIDEGLYNINNTKMNVHLGLTAGEAFASSSDTFTTPGLFQTSNGVSTNANVPFYGVYAALTGNGLAATFQWRRNLFDLSLNDPSLGTQGPQKLNAQGNTESIDVGYQMPFGNGYSFTPAAAFYLTQTNVDSLAVGSSIFQFDALNSTLGRFGGRLATAYTLNENLFLVPYLTLNVWHEFQGTSTTNFSQPGSTALPVPAVTTNSVGTFGQVSLGFATQSPKSNITTYLQADLRVGSNIQGWGVIGGLRYSY